MSQDETSQDEMSIRNFCLLNMIKHSNLFFIIWRAFGICEQKKDRNDRSELTAHREDRKWETLMLSS